MADKPKLRKLLDIAPTEPDLEKRAAYGFKDSMLPVCVGLHGATTGVEVFKWNGTMLCVARMNLNGDRFWSEAALGFLKPRHFVEACWEVLPLERLPIPHSAPFRYRD
jgi:hypothetical protein